MATYKENLNEINKRCTSDFISGKISNPNEIYICCPFCNPPDETYKMCVDFEKYGGIFHCFRCDASGKLSSDWDWYEKSNDDSLDILKNRTKNLFKTNFEDIQELDIEKFSYELLEKETPIAWKYLLDRGILPEEIKKHSLRVGKSYTEIVNDKEKFIQKWRGRIIFPFIENGKITYAIGRTYTNRIPKYLNCIGSKANIIYGLDNVKGKAILCEGIISAMAAERYTGIPGISVLGKFISGIQLSKIRTKCNKIYLSFDGGLVKNEYNKAIIDLISHGFEVWKIDLPFGKDPDDLKQEYFKYFKTAKQVNMLY